jgi:hypothetical protein
MIAALRKLPRLETSLAVVAALILIALAYFRESPGRNPTQQLDSYSSYDAASGGYRAWYELLQRERLRVDRFEERPAFLDASVDTLVWADPLGFDPRQISNSAADIGALEAWVKNGGRLLYIGHDDAAAAQHLLNLPASRQPVKHARPFVAPELRADGVAHVVPFVALRWRANPKNVLLGDKGGALVVRYRYGKGTVTAAIDEPAFTNARIALGDQARLGFALAQPHAPGGTIAFDETVHGFLVPEHWWTIVPRAFAIALWGALAVLLIAFAGAAIRLGPALQPAPRGDATSGEFIDALGALYERGSAARKAMLDAAASTKRVVAKTLGMRDDEPVERIAAGIDEPGRRARFLSLVQLARNASPSDANLVRAVALAQTLRKDFESHARSRH